MKWCGEVAERGRRGRGKGGRKGSEKEKKKTYYVREGKGKEGKKKNRRGKGWWKKLTAEELATLGDVHLVLVVPLLVLLSAQLVVLGRSQTTGDIALSFLDLGGLKHLLGAGAVLVSA